MSAQKPTLFAWHSFLVNAFSSSSFFEDRWGWAFLVDRFRPRTALLVNSSPAKQRTTGANYGNVAPNNRIVVYLDDQLIFGTFPSDAPARIGASEPGTLLQALPRRNSQNPSVGQKQHGCGTGYIVQLEAFHI